MQRPSTSGFFTCPKSCLGATAGMHARACARTALQTRMHHIGTCNCPVCTACILHGVHVLMAARQAGLQSAGATGQHRPIVKTALQLWLPVCTSARLQAGVAAEVQVRPDVAVRTDHVPQHVRAAGLLRARQAQRCGHSLHARAVRAPDVQ